MCPLTKEPCQDGCAWRVVIGYTTTYIDKDGTTKEFDEPKPYCGCVLVQIGENLERLKDCF